MDFLQKECRANNVPNVKFVKTYADTKMYSRKVKKREFVFAEFNPKLVDPAMMALSSLIHKENKRRMEIRKVRAKTARAAGTSRRLEKEPAAAIQSPVPNPSSRNIFPFSV